MRRKRSSFTHFTCGSTGEISESSVDGRGRLRVARDGAGASVFFPATGFLAIMEMLKKNELMHEQHEI